ncbi:PTS lactose/cellobiose transporter subunit IIA [Anaerosinus massiliensis]|uniref:PTS lactose/cellobiose transporter subunit IIA n=1 Tax=Massilibacillus massiliensis TaxID=1806837 RepID=UPI000ABB7D3A|nr:PTS lactose/cellobiose transporter subunit IIA [Massilibacillus massiliensis]
MNEETLMMMILGAGEANRLAISALGEVRNKNFAKARELIKEASKKSLETHKIQTELIQREASNEKMELGLLTVHAQDHLMNAILVIDLVEELIDVFEAYA